MNVRRWHAGMVHMSMLLVLAAVPAVLAATWHPRAPVWSDTVSPGEVTLATIHGWPAAPLWIDARSAASFHAGHRNGALPLNLSTWSDQVEAVIDRWIPGRPVVVYCEQQACRDSAQVAQQLRDRYRIPDVWVLHGGWRALQMDKP